MKIIFILYLIALSLAGKLFAHEKLDLYLSGTAQYSSSEEQLLNNILKINYKFKLHEPLHKKYIIYLSGEVKHDFDIFGNKTKVTGFSALSIDF
jgi:hypothetical protein